MMRRPHESVAMRHSAARILALASVSAIALGAAGCAAIESGLASKSLSDPSESSTAEAVEGSEAEGQAPEASAPGSSKGKATSPVFSVTIDTSLALERYAYQTSKGAGTCYNGQPDRPPYTVEANTLAEFCVHPSDPLKSVDAMVDVTYKIVDDQEGRTLWIKGNGPQVGENTIACEVRKADMKTRDDGSPYLCSTEWLGDVKSYAPRPRVTLRPAGTLVQ